MFSSGQKLFALFFILVFASILIWSYRKDINLHKFYYKKVWVVALGIILVITTFTVITFLLHE